MSRKRIITIIVAAFAVPLTFYATASAHPHHSRATGYVVGRDVRFVKCMQTLTENDFCKARALSRRSWPINDESQACRLAQRQIQQYGRALQLLEARGSKHRKLAPLYSQARMAVVESYKKQC